MTISPGMLLFCIFDATVAFFLVFHITKARFYGNSSHIGYALSVIISLIVASVFLGVTIWFNTSPHTVSATAKLVVYLAPIVLSILMIILVWLSAPPKKKDAEPEEKTSDSESQESDSTNNQI